MARTSTPSISKKALAMIDRKQSDNLEATKERDKTLTMLEIFGGDEQKTAIANEVSTLILKGRNDSFILEHVNTHYGVDWTMRKLSLVKKMIQKMWVANTTHNMDDYKAKQLAVIDVQLSEAWDAWEKSKHNKHTKKRKETSLGSTEVGTTYDLTEEVEEQDDVAGDPRYMQLIVKLTEMQNDLLGLKGKGNESAGSNQTNIQFNVVGDSSTAKSADLFSMFMSMGSGMMSQQAIQKNVEDASIEVVDSNPVAETVSMEDAADVLFEQLMK